MSGNLVEFECNDCDGWILITIQDHHLGEFRVKCPNCGRMHPRLFRKNSDSSIDAIQITSQVKYVGKTRVKITRDGGAGPILAPMKSAYSKTSRLDRFEKDFREKRNLGQITTAELWRRCAQPDDVVDFIVEETKNGR